MFNELDFEISHNTCDEMKFIFIDKLMIGFEKVEMEYRKLLIASGLLVPSLEYENVVSVTDQFSHAELHNKSLKAEDIVLLGSSFEIYQLASAIRTYLAKYDKFPNITIIDD